MADRPRDDGWWQASDGKWYPPELLDAPRPQWPTTEQVPVVPRSTSTDLPSATPAIVAIIVASVMSALAAFGGFNLASVVNASSEPAFVNGEPTHVSETGTWAFAIGLQYLSLAVSAILLIVFLFKTSKAFGARGASSRSWSSGWTIGAWFIPVGSLIIPRFVFGELEKIAQVPYGGVPIEDRWKQYSRTSVADLWWFMWVAGSVVTWVGTVGGNVSIDDDGAFASFVTIASTSSILIAVSGVALVISLRNLARAASQ